MNPKALTLSTKTGRLTLHASLNAEPFYANLGYSAFERTEVALPNGHPMAVVRMGKDL